MKAQVKISLHSIHALLLQAARGKGSQVQAQSGVSRTITEEGKKWMGSPATHLSDHMRSQVVFTRLPEMEKKIAELEKLVAELRKVNDNSI